MNQYILISNKQEDVEYQYNDFLYEPGLSLCFMKFNRGRVHFKRILKYFHMDSFRIVKKLYYEKIFKNEIFIRDESGKSDKKIFIFTGRVYEQYGEKIVQYVKTRFYGCVTVLYIVDMVYSMKYSIEKAKEVFDYVCSFDKGDAETYEINFLIEPFSVRLLRKLPCVEKSIYDITFVGHAKNRYERIISIYEALRKNGLKCDFHISGVPKQNQKYADEIHYGWIGFKELLMCVKRSECVLELVQNDEYSATTRYSEAMLLGKNLLSDCRALEEEENREENIFTFHKVEEIPFEELKKKKPYNLDKYETKFSIKEFILSLNKIMHETN